MEFCRQAEKQLTAWLNSVNRKPLVIRGARQVGKSTLVRSFVRGRKLELIEINLEKNVDLERIFAKLDTPTILRELSNILKIDVKLNQGQLLFLDEIQATPSALKWLRYAYEEIPSLPVIAAGSLLEFALEDKDFTMPVGRVDFLWLRPMSFHEYLIASGDEFHVKALHEFSLEEPQKFSQKQHESLMQRQREYLFLGGMPAVIRAFLQEGVNSAQNVAESIVTSYLDDLAKYRKKQPHVRLQRVLRNIPGALGTQVKYVNLSRQDKHKDIKESLELLALAGVVIPVTHSDCSGIPLGAQENPDVFKLLFLDVGLACRLMGLDYSYQTQLDDESLINEGALAEQFVGQEYITSLSPHESAHLHYWRREKHQSNAEVDFVIAVNRDILPIEVKAGTSGSLRSLHQFMHKMRLSRAIRFDAQKPSRFDVHTTIPTEGGQVDVQYQLISLPLYLASEVRRLIKG